MKNCFIKEYNNREVRDMMAGSDNCGFRRHLPAILMLVIFFAAASDLFGAQPSHLDRAKNPAGCSACHAGHGKKGTQMLRASTQDLCFSCHGLSPRGNPKDDVYSVFNKRSRHPVFNSARYHSPYEELPEKYPSTPRHVSCQDCHKVHEVETDKPYKAVRGYKRGIQGRAEVVDEYEVCYKCHSDSANLPPGSKNKREEFDINNASYHPIEAAGRNSRVPSLKEPLNVGSRITCSDCHGNNDSYGARGPHGSDYEFMLRAEYVMSETAEAPTAYELCYGCHERQSILGNQSFQKHKEHIVYKHIPCFACHTPHGSIANPHLISFSPNFVSGMTSSYMPANNGKPMCYLECHVEGKKILHDNNFYWGTKGGARKWP